MKNSRYQHRPELRATVREYLQLLPAGRRATVVMITDAVNRLTPLVVPKEEVVSILGWMQDRDQVHVIKNPDLDREEWFLSDITRQRLNP